MKCFLSVIVILLAFSGFGQDIYDNNIRPADADPAYYLHLLKGKRVALIINQTSVVGDKSLLDIMLGGKVKVVKIFVPEHGFRGKEDAGAHIDNATDSATGLPVISLYGKHKQPTAEDLADVDVMVYDLQDVGVRFYTYISTLEYCMRSCAEQHKTFMVLDRPDPNGFYVDGPVLDDANRSFVGMQRIPVVYGMTAGEYAKMLVGERWFDKAGELNLEVIKCTGYNHHKKYKLPVAPSPNLRTMAAVYAYPSLCLFEGTVMSVGRGTDMPFQQYGCPQLEGKFSYSFTPQSSPGAKNPPFENMKCFGELIGTGEAEVLKKINNQFTLDWLIKAYTAHPDKEHFFTAFFAKLAGTMKLQDEIKDGKTAEQIRGAWQDDIIAFKKLRKRYLLYEDFE